MNKNVLKRILSFSMIIMLIAMNFCGVINVSAATTYTVIFESNGGTSVSNITANNGTTISKPTDPTKAGHTFAGWYKDGGFSTVWDFAVDTVTADITLYAKWNINQYTVTFNSDGGSNVASATVDYNTTVSKPTDPTKTGYTFGGWYKESGLANAWNFATDKVTANTDLYAKWTVNQYEVTFESNGGSSVAKVNANYNTTIAKPTDPTKTEATFGGWFKDNSFSTAWNFATDKVTADTTLYAKWTVNQYTVTFNSDGGSNVASATVDYNTAVSKPADPIKTGYTFADWYKESGLANAWNFATDKVTADTTLYAKWTINQYTVTFNSDGGSNVASLNADYNTTISKPTDPTKTESIFGGWFKESSFINAWDFATDKVTADTTLYAKWTVNQYTVTFNSDGGSNVGSATVDYNTAVSKPTDPTKTGYTFAGWYKESGLANAWNFATDKVTADTTLYAKWTINQYTVTFNSDGGSNVASLNVDYNTTISKPTDPTKTESIFGGWFKESSFINAWDFATDKVTADTTLYAKWTVNQYTVTFNSDGGSNVASATVDYNTAISKPTDPTKTGYTFAGWYKESGLANSWDFATDKVTENTTLYAKWTINQYEVTFESNGGSSVAKVNANFNSTISEPTQPTRIEATFQGWYKDSGFADVWEFTTDKVTANITLYAKWNVNQYTVTFNSDGGGNVASATVDYNTIVSKPSDPTKTGYTFGGWYKESGLANSWDFAADKVTADTTLYAKWTVNQYEVTFESNGGSSVAKVNANYNSTISEPTQPTRIEATFQGWYKDAGFATAWDFATDKVTANITLYAKWNVNQYTVAFNSNGGSNVASATVDYNTTVSNPTEPTKANYTFAGWYKDNSFTDDWDFATDKVTANITLYAKWTVNQYTVTFNSNEGSSVGSINADYNTTITKPSDPTKSQATFEGWYKDSSFTDDWDFATDKVTANITLHAKWTVNQYTVTFNSDGGSNVASVTVDFNTTISKPTDPTKTGYTFAGWYKESGLTNTWNFATDNVTGNTTLYAKWTVSQYTVSFNTNGGSAVSQVSTDYNTTIAKPTDPTKTEATFEGWYKDSGFTAAWNFAADKVTGDITLFAKWDVNQYPVTFNSNGGSPVSSISASYNTTISQPTNPTRSGYTFAGWYKESGLTNAWNFSTDKVTVATTLFAKWNVYHYSSGSSSSSLPPAKSEIDDKQLTKKTTTETIDGEKVEVVKITVSPSVVARSVSKAKKEKKNVEIRVNSKENQKVVVELPKFHVSQLAASGLVIDSNDGTSVELPKELLTAISKDKQGVNIEIHKVNNEFISEQMNKDDYIYSTKEISTNFSGETILRFKAPANAVADELKIKVLHSDGSIEEITPIIVKSNNESYLEFSVNQFSTFIVYKPAPKTEEKVENKTNISLTIGLNTAIVNGKSHTIDSAPFIKAGSNRTLVPLRLVSELLGADVKWLADTRQVLIVSEGKEILLTINSNLVDIDGQQITIDSAAEIIETRTYVPIRFVSETLGADVEYVVANKEIIITKK